MDIFMKALFAALLATVAIIGFGQAGLKTNDLRNYPNLKPADGPANGLPGMADVAPNSAAAQVNPNIPQGNVKGTAGMTKGEEAAAQSGFSTELENPNK